MASYSIYLPPSGSTEDRETGFRLLQDGKSLLALAVPPLWLAWHRLWVQLMVYLVVAATIGLAMKFTGSQFVVMLSALPGLYLFLEGQELRRGELERQGWQFESVVEAANEEEAELRFLNSRGPNFVSTLQKPRQAIVSSIARKPIIASGIFPE